MSSTHRARLLFGAFAATVGVIGATWMFRSWRAGRDDPWRYEEKLRSLDQRFANGHPDGGVLVTGSSYMELWETAAADLAPLDVTNIGIGGTRVGDHLFHFDRMLSGFDPRVVLVYVGSNDINGSRLFSKSAGRTVPMVLRYLDRLHTTFPTARIYYVAITEAPSRARVRDEIRTANLALAQAAAASRAFTFIDTAPALLRADGSIDESLFGEDRLHLNTRGYEVFADAIRSALAVEYLPAGSA